MNFEEIVHIPQNELCEMKKTPTWQYDENKHIGVDYGNCINAQTYDEKLSVLADIDKECQEIIEVLQLNQTQTLLDIGAGTGAFAIHAAQRCKKVIAVDISPAMLTCARQKAMERGIQNLEFMHGGFLTYEHGAEPVDVIITQLALHHLPDFWKQYALISLTKIMQPNGKLYLKDIVFSFDPMETDAFFNRLMQHFDQNVDPFIAREMKTHIREEYSTFGWIMEGMLEKAGFSIRKKTYQHQFMAHYLCIKNA
ncbi:MAG: class I SAM-dependent methyltransferase [Candidatus Omnitrophota bacterium]|jgi:ubiquinone/menaquinone biosynthesis C-methylase UbiE|nr:MAG: class I SAM-dependent methyltransferase [Candidatus Omnitrophota bacterium]